jgi:hypothetical protein
MKIKIKNKSIILENKESIKNIIWYNGSSKPRLTWTTENVGKGNDQNGPGLYFTTNEENARSYGEHLHKVRLEIKKNRICPLNGRFEYEYIKYLIEKSPNYKEYLTNWDENPKIALHQAVSSISNLQNGKFDMLQQIWYDFYRHEPIEFLQVVSEKYDMAIVTAGTDRHAIVFNPEVIKPV